MQKLKRFWQELKGLDFSDKVFLGILLYGMACLIAVFYNIAHIFMHEELNMLIGHVILVFAWPFGPIGFFF